jgi:hypothetical protein
MIEYVNINEVIELNERAGRHFFDADTIRFFRSRIDSGAFRLPDGRLIFTESIAGGFRKTEAGRRRVYRINAMDSATGDVSRIAEYSSAGARNKGLFAFLQECQGVTNA